MLLPYLLVRALLALPIWFYTGLARGQPHPLGLPAWLEVWARWDAGWYLRIAERGYEAVSDLRQESSLAFFPAYPLLIRALHALLPASLQGPEARVWVGLLVSHVCLLVALALLHHACERHFGAGVDADRTVLYLLVFPAGFFFHCVYSESLFLLLATAAFVLAFRGQWWGAGLAGFALATCRPTGVLLAPALAWLYLAQRGWRWREVRADVLALALIPLGFAAVGYHAYLQSGAPLAIIQVQAAWLRTFTSPRATFEPLAYPHPLIDPFSRALLVLFLVLGALSLRALASPALGLFALLSMAPLWFSGTLTSVPRMLAVLFPVFALLSRYGRHPLVHHAVLLGGMTLQVLLVLAWARGLFVA